MERVSSILLVDNDEIDNYVHKKVIGILGIANRIDVALNGAEALTHIQKFYEETESCPEIIFLDINMPIMNGFEFLKEYKNLSVLNKKEVKIIVLTSSIDLTDMQKLRNYNITGIMDKPLTKEKLMEVLKIDNGL